MRRFSTFVRGLAAAALALGLSACIVSTEPKFPASSAVAALGDGGTFGVFEREDGKMKRSETMIVRRKSGNLYEFVNEKGEAVPVSFHPIGKGRHVLQGGAEGTPPKGWGYVVVQITGGEMLTYPVDCDKQDKARLAAAGVDLSKKYECGIDKVADPVALFDGFALGEPNSKLVRE